MKGIFSFLIVFTSLLSFGQKFTVSGTVKDASTGENLIGASIYNAKNGAGTTSNNYGFFSITLPKDSVKLKISFVGYGSLLIHFLLLKDTTITIPLLEGTSLKEIVIEGQAEEIQESSRMSTIDIPVDQIKAMPALLGETDVLKVLQLLPGVQAGSEGSSGLYVRGGGPDQNLILLDGVPVYNASHLFGFFSVFNADAINHVELVKGGFPARYGGRLSSVIDINLKEGNNQKIKGEGSIGLIASRLTIEGPIKKDRTTFIVSARRTYIDVLARPLIKSASKGEEQAGYYFYDLNAKINHRINNNNRLYLSAYTGDDKAFARSKYQSNGTIDKNSYKYEAGLKWGNITTALRLNSILSKKLFSNTTLSFSRYRFGISGSDSESYTKSGVTTSQYYATSYISGIRDFAAKIDFDYIPSPRHYVKFGGQAIRHLFTPGVASFHSTTTEQIDTTFGAKRIYATEFYAYAEDDFLVTEKLKINGGVHVSGFSVENRFYHSIQPRFSARYLISPDISWKGSYAQMTQFIHLLSNVGIGLPTDLWVPATSAVGPEQSYLTSTGIAYNIQKKYEFSVEGYYKKMTGLIEYKEGADYLNTEDDWQTKVERGKGWSYGGEVFLHKKTGKINGWVGYTLSWTNRQFANINQGKIFPYRYDRRHDIKIAVTYDWKPNRNFSVTWVYGTGAAITLPQSNYAQLSDRNFNLFYPPDNNVQYYDGRNSYRMRAYHRLDLSYTTTKKTKWGERSWTIGVYNAYSRRNPFFINMDYDKAGNKKFIQYSLFPIIPSIAYRFKF
jgi:hypothetical protein